MKDMNLTPSIESVVSAWRTLTLGLVLFLMAGCAGIGGQHYIDEFTVTVVDAETGEPLEGVLMLAGWDQKRTTLHGDISTGTRAIKEGLSDKNGVIHFPRSIEKGTTAAGQVNRESNPIFVLYKEGFIDDNYRNVTGDRIYRRIKNKPLNEDGTPYKYGHSYAQWSRGVIRLEKLPEDYDAEKIYRDSYLVRFVRGVGGLLYESDDLGEKCTWDLIPISKLTAYKLYQDYKMYSDEELLKSIEKSINSNKECKTTYNEFKEKYL